MVAAGKLCSSCSCPYVLSAYPVQYTTWGYGSDYTQRGYLVKGHPPRCLLPQSRCVTIRTHGTTEVDDEATRAGDITMRRLIILSVIVVITAVVVIAQLTGDEGGSEPDPAPAAQDGPTQEEVASVAQDVPSPDACTIEPRSIEAMQALVGTPIARPATPVPSPAGGVPVDATTIGGVVETYRMVTACFNAGDFARAYALYTDDYLRRLLAEVAARAEVDPQVIPIALATPQTVPPMRWTAVRAIGNVRSLPDGRVVASVVTVRVSEATNPAAEQVRLVFFVRDGDRWLIDGYLDPTISATPIPSPAGTPLGTPSP